MATVIPQQLVKVVQAELERLDQAYIEVEGKLIKPSTCYYFGTDPAHILYNTNCPDTLKEKINWILEKYSLTDENSSSK